MLNLDSSEPEQAHANSFFIFKKKNLNHYTVSDKSNLKRLFNTWAG